QEHLAVPSGLDRDGHLERPFSDYHPQAADLVPAPITDVEGGWKGRKTRKTGQKFACILSHGPLEFYLTCNEVSENAWDLAKLPALNPSVLCPVLVSLLLRFVTLPV